MVPHPASFLQLLPDVMLFLTSVCSWERRGRPGEVRVAAGAAAAAAAVGAGDGICEAHRGVTGMAARECC